VIIRWGRQQSNQAASGGDLIGAWFFGQTGVISSDVVVLSDTCSATVRYSAVATDVVILTDDPSGQAEAHGAVFDEVVLSDDADGNELTTIFAVLCEDGVVLSDAEISSAQVPVLAEDGVEVSDSPSAAQQFEAAAEDGVVASDGPSASKTFLFDPNDPRFGARGWAYLRRDA
jgi:hypothetical protein